MNPRQKGRPRLLDLFCGAGGCTRGYQEAGFYVVGVDLHDQPNYCGDEFVQADALEFLRLVIEDGVCLGAPLDAISASPPCQHHAPVTRWRGSAEDHPELIAPTRELLEETGIPWVIENVPGAPLATSSDLFGNNGVRLCGTMFGLSVRRHRLFETSFPISAPAACNHHPEDASFDHGSKQPESVYREAMGVPWMTVAESRQAIPPAFTRFIGEQLLNQKGSPMNPPLKEAQRHWDAYKRVIDSHIKFREATEAELKAAEQKLGEVEAEKREAVIAWAEQREQLKEADAERGRLIEALEAEADALERQNLDGDGPADLTAATVRAVKAQGIRDALAALQTSKPVIARAEQPERLKGAEVALGLIANSRDWPESDSLSVGSPMDKARMLADWALEGNAEKLEAARAALTSKPDREGNS